MKLRTSDWAVEEDSALKAKWRRAKIVCTIGPASDSEEMIADLMRLGMDVARLNFSHGTHQQHARVIERLRKVARQLDRTICILQDLQGPKMRTGPLRDGKPVLLTPGRRFTITTREVVGTPELVSTTFHELSREVQPGNPVLLSDGKLSLKVLEVKGEDVVCEVVDGGILGEHQGINLPGAVLSVPSLTDKDYEDLKFGLDHSVDAVAVSFVRSANDVRKAKAAIASHGTDTVVCAKLEKPQAIENLDEILEIADWVMVARGDLGVEMAPEKVPIIQKHVIARAAEYRKPVITATQMLESMMQNPRPTRAEASDVANAIIDGTDAVMLSGETAAGQYPREAVRMMARLVTETERHLSPSAGLGHRRNHDRQLSISEAICESTAHIAEDLNLGAIAIYTESGTTARMISKYRPRAEVYAFAHIPVVCNRLNLLWGVRPIATAPFHTVEEMVANTENFLLETGVVQAGDVVGIVAGTQSTSGSTNSIRLHRVGEHREAGSQTSFAKNISREG
ncbi:MAG: pyruvate kinase [Candidatus Korobacteraceae bacterium]|jgi:pyruvate kinase